MLSSPSVGMVSTTTWLPVLSSCALSFAVRPARVAGVISSALSTMRPVNIGTSAANAFEDELYARDDERRPPGEVVAMAGGGGGAGIV